MQEINIYFTNFLQLLPVFFFNYLLCFNALAVNLWLFRGD
ncbi:hypothetical protein [Methylomonas fluvii]|nr:hypothetical protein [Methylomonas fluvii]CAD6873825.1 hypothetical protein [Methylomonas fluvii]CAD6874031.1 hypothetical protein [Methylomonas fluvii]